MTPTPANTRFFRLAIFLLAGICVFQRSQAQDLSNLKEGPNFKINGGLNVNQVLYLSNNEQRSRDPYNYFLGGNVSVSAYGLSIPLSFSYSNQDFSFSQPFNQYGLQPTYKWIRGYVGFNSLNFSKYTLAGHIFNGVGVELTPDIPFSATVMYGRFQKAVSPEQMGNGAQPAFRRMGYGMKLAYTPNGNRYEVSFFSASDDSTSLLLDSLPIDPQQNVAIGINLSQKLGKLLNVTVEYGNSSLTRDMAAPKVDARRVETRFQPVAWLNGLNPRRSSTAYYQALKAGLNANLQVVTIGVGYERIDPDYATLGAYYFNSDLENLTANVSTALFENRVNLAVNAGAQRNNLDGNQTSGTARFVGSANVSGQVSDRLSVNVSYSNFQTFARLQNSNQFGYLNSLSDFDSVNVDTLSFVQVNQTGSLSASYVLSTDKDNPMALVANVSYSNSADNNPESVAGATFYNVSTAYSYTNQPRGLGLTAAANATITVQDTIRTTQFGPTLSANQSLLDKALRLTASASANRMLSNVQNSTGWLGNFRVSGNYQFKEKHQFRLNATILNRPGRQADETRQTEFTANLGYSFSF